MLATPSSSTTLEAMVNVDCGSYSPDGVNRIADMCEARFEEHGWEVERRPHDGAPRLGDLVIGRLRGAGGPNVLLVGHMDTVFDDGTVAERPFRVDGDIARGPGVSDMKAGLLAGFFATHVLQDVGFDGFGTITYVCNPDEEIGSPFSGPVIRELAPSHDAAFVLEGARANGDIVSARKGITDFAIKITGRAAHAGVEPEKGRNAVLQAAHTIVALQGAQRPVARRDRRTSAWSRGGTRRTSSPSAASSRSTSARPSSRRSRRPRRRSSGSVPTRPSRTCTIDDDRHGWHRPMEKGGGGRAPRGHRRRAPRRSWGSRCGTPRPGGASDANTTSSAGTPTIDGLGPVGGDDHAPAEWVDLTSIVPRTASARGDHLPGVSLMTEIAGSGAGSRGVPSDGRGCPCDPLPRPAG